MGERLLPWLGAALITSIIGAVALTLFDKATAPAWGAVQLFGGGMMTLFVIPPQKAANAQRTTP